jgi:hypothetical protein
VASQTLVPAALGSSYASLDSSAAKSAHRAIFFSEIGAFIIHSENFFE